MQGLWILKNAIQIFIFFLGQVIGSHSPSFTIYEQIPPCWLAYDEVLDQQT